MNCHSSHRGRGALVDIDQSWLESETFHALRGGGRTDLACLKKTLCQPPRHFHHRRSEETQEEDWPIDPKMECLEKRRV